MKCSPGTPMAALSLALCLGPLFAHAQGFNRDADRERERKLPRAEDRERAAAERHRREAGERDRLRERQAHQRRERERAQRERNDASRRLNETRQTERERKLPRAEDRVRAESERHRQEAAERARERARRAEERRERSQSERRENTPRPPAQAATPAPRAASNSHSLPATTNPPRPVIVSGVTCDANPTCPSTTGYGNACRSVQNSYTGADAMQRGRRDIVNRCRAANVPDACSPNFRLAFGGGCAQQCASVAICTSTASR